MDKVNKLLSEYYKRLRFELAEIGATFVCVIHDYHEIYCPKQHEERCRRILEREYARLEEQLRALGLDSTAFERFCAVLVSHEENR